MKTIGISSSRTAQATCKLKHQLKASHPLSLRIHHKSKPSQVPASSDDAAATTAAPTQPGIDWNARNRKRIVDDIAQVCFASLPFCVTSLLNKNDGLQPGVFVCAVCAARHTGVHMCIIDQL